MKRLPGDFFKLEERAQKIFKYYAECREGVWNAMEHANGGFWERRSMNFFLAGGIALIVLYASTGVYGVTGVKVPGWVTLLMILTCVVFFLLFAIFHNVGKRYKENDRSNIFARRMRQINNDPKYVAAESIWLAIYGFDKLARRYLEAYRTRDENSEVMENAVAERLHTFLTQNYGLVVGAIDHYLASERSLVDKEHSFVGPVTYLVNGDALDVFKRKSEEFLKCPSSGAVGQLASAVILC